MVSENICQEPTSSEPEGTDRERDKEVNQDSYFQLESDINPIFPSPSPKMIIGLPLSMLTSTFSSTSRWGMSLSESL